MMEYSISYLNLVLDRLHLRTDFVGIVNIVDDVDIVDTVEAIWNNARLCSNLSQKP